MKALDELKGIGWLALFAAAGAAGVVIAIGSAAWIGGEILVAKVRARRVERLEVRA